MPYMVHEGLKRAVSALEFVDAGEIWSQLTAIKHPNEVELIRDAVRVADLGAAAAMRAVRPGVSEHAVVGRSGLCHAQGTAPSSSRSFRWSPPATTPRCSSASRPRRSSSPGEMVILDIGAVVKGYTGDLGRTVICGDPIDGAEGDLPGNVPRAAGGEENHQAGRHLPRDRPARARGHRGCRLGQLSLQRQYRPSARLRPARRSAGGPERRLRGRREHGDVPGAADRAARPARHRRRASGGCRGGHEATASSRSIARRTMSGCCNDRLHPNQMPN